jgi:hypothetical protein
MSPEFSPEFSAKWERLLADVDKRKIPIQFIKKLVLKLRGKRQHTINIEKLLQQGLQYEQVEDAVSRKLEELDSEVVGMDFVLNVQSIADTVQPATDALLKNL